MFVGGTLLSGVSPPVTSPARTRCNIFLCAASSLAAASVVFCFTGVQSSGFVSITLYPTKPRAERLIHICRAVRLVKLASMIVVSSGQWLCVLDYGGQVVLNPRIDRRRREELCDGKIITSCLEAERRVPRNTGSESCCQLACLCHFQSCIAPAGKSGRCSCLLPPRSRRLVLLLHSHEGSLYWSRQREGKGQAGYR